LITKKYIHYNFRTRDLIENMIRFKIFLFYLCYP
jgi:hypothetical protein